MGDLALTVEERIGAPPDAVYQLFGSGDAGWLFGARCDRVAVGEMVTMRAPLDGPHAPPVDLLGRISAARPPHRLEIVHDQPWRGRVRLRLDPAGRGTRVRLVAEIDRPGLEWLIRRRGHPLPGGAAAGSPRIGLLTTKSGPGNLFAAAMDNVAALSVEEINDEGGLLGRPVVLVVGDDRTDPEVGVAEAWRLYRAGCRTILVSTTSATFARVSEALRPVDVLLVHSLMNEGGLTDRLRIQLGERPPDQLAAAARPMMRIAGGNRWFLAGNDYNFPRRANQVAREVLPRHGARVVGERFEPLGTEDFGPLIERIQAARPDVVLSTFVGADSAAFERQCHAMGLRDRCRTLAMAMDESTLERVGAEAGAGIYGVSGYFERLDTEANTAVLARYRARFGRWAPPLSTLSESLYEAFRMYADAVRRCGTDEPGPVARAMRAGRYDFPRGEVEMDGSDRPRQRLHLAEAVGGVFTPMTTF